MKSNDFIDWFSSIANGTNELKKDKSNKELMQELTLHINDLCEEYECFGIRLVSAERNEKGKIRCNFKIVGVK